MKVKNKIFIIILIIFVLLLLIIALFSVNNGLIGKIGVDKKSEIVRDIIFEPYSNENNLIVLVTVEDSENGIDTITYTSKEGKEIVINANKKNKVAIDYEIEKDGEYVFTAYNDIGEKIEKTLVIDSINNENDTFGDLIDIQIDPIIDEGRTIATKANVTINYHYGFGNNYYKIGNQTSWSEYSDSFQINSYTIIENSLQENDNKTITIYGKKQDEVNNKIVITKQTTELDIDMPAMPEILIETDEYPTLTMSGVKLHYESEIQYDNRNDITNYYSIDNGETWNEYKGEKLSGDKSIPIYAKSVKNNSGLEITSQKTVKPAANDAIGIEAYDGNENTYYNHRPSGTSRYMNVAEDMMGKDMILRLTKGYAYHGYINIYFYDSDSQNISTLRLLPYSITGYSSYDGLVKIPDRTSRFQIYIELTGSGEYGINIYNVAPPRIESITFSDTNEKWGIGQSDTLVFSYEPSNYPINKYITWTSSDSNVLQVDENGVATGISEGTATVTGTANGVTSSCTIQVKKNLFEYIANSGKTLEELGMTITKGYLEYFTFDPSDMKGIYGGSGSGIHNWSWNFTVPGDVFNEKGSRSIDSIWDLRINNDNGYISTCTAEVLVEYEDGEKDSVQTDFKLPGTTSETKKYRLTLKVEDKPIKSVTFKGYGYDNDWGSSNARLKTILY